MLAGIRSQSAEKTRVRVENTIDLFGQECGFHLFWALSYLSSGLAPGQRETNWCLMMRKITWSEVFWGLPHSGSPHPLHVGKCLRPPDISPEGESALHAVQSCDLDHWQ